MGYQGSKRLLVTAAAVIVLAIVAANFAVRSNRRSTASSDASLPEVESARLARTRVSALRTTADSDTIPNPRHTTAETTRPTSRTAIALRGPSGVIGSTNTLTSGTAAVLSTEQGESPEERQDRWKKLGLQLVPVRVVDVTSAPIQDVLITVDGVHSGQNGKSIGHGGWNQSRFGTVPSAKTNAEGRAYLASPVIISDLREATGISFTAKKSGYAKRRIFRYPVDGTEEDVVLKQGNTLIVRAFLETPSKPVADFKPQTFWSEVRAEDWISLPDGRKMIDTFPSGKHVLTVVHEAMDHTKWHSDNIPIEFKDPGVKEIDVRLTRGLTLRGRVSDNVPRPIALGQVIACSQYPPPGSVNLAEEPKTMREERSVIAPDGTFEITGLPEGPGEIIGLCEGFIASHRGPNAKAYEQNQRYDLRTASDATPFILEMEPTGSVRVHIFDNTGQPLPDIVVNTWPNVFWAVGVSSIYVSASLWSATTDKQGVATIRGLRAGTEGVAVTGKNWQAPARVGSSGAVVRTMDATITPGQITDLMVTMEPAENTGEAQ